MVLWQNCKLFGNILTFFQVFCVRLHCMPMRHRKVPPNWDVVAPVSRPLASAVLDLMVTNSFVAFQKCIKAELVEQFRGLNGLLWQQQLVPPSWNNTQMKIQILDIKDCGQLVHYSDHDLNTRPFDDWTHFNPLNTRLVGNLYPICTVLCERKLIFQGNTHPVNTAPDQSWANPNRTNHISFHKWVIKWLGLWQ